MTLDERSKVGEIIININTGEYLYKQTLAIYNKIMSNMYEE